MGLAGGLFWLAAGLLYIWYRAVKEDAEGTIASTILVILGVCGVAGIFLIYKWLGDLNIWAGFAWGIACIAAVLIWVVRVNVKENKRKARAEELKSQAWEIVKDLEFTDEEIRKHAEIWLIFHPEKKFDYKWHPEAFREEITEDYRRVKQSSEWYKLMEKEGVPFS